MIARLKQLSIGEQEKEKEEYFGTPKHCSHYSLRFSLIAA